MRPILIVTLLLLLAACAKVPPAVPKAYIDDVQPAGFPHVRDWGFQASPEYQKKLLETVRLNKGKAINMLAISGGGSYGAFSAGLLNGWSKAGTRPKFQVVTGVSTGALIAPFAFLGKPYDKPMAQLYTSIRTEHIFSLSFPLWKILTRQSAVGSSEPLQQLLARFITRDFLDQIVLAANGGRRLLVGTVNLDAMDFVIWDLVEIAKVKGPRAVHLFRQVLLASASIPVAVPPVYIPVSYQGRDYAETHVDGGVSSSVFISGLIANISAASKHLNMRQFPVVNLYIIRNNYVTPPYAPVTRQMFPIAKRALLSLTSSQGKGDLMRIYLRAQKQDMNFHFIAVPSSFEYESKELIDPGEMRALYALGKQIAVHGIPWLAKPPRAV